MLGMEQNNDVNENNNTIAVDRTDHDNLSLGRKSFGNESEGVLKGAWRRSNGVNKQIKALNYETNAGAGHVWKDTPGQSVILSNTTGDSNTMSISRVTLASAITGILDKRKNFLNNEIRDLMNDRGDITTHTRKRVNHAVENANIGLQNSIERVLEETAEQMIKIAAEVAQQENEQITLILKNCSKQHSEQVKIIVDDAGTQIFVVAQNYSLSDVAAITERIDQENGGIYDLITNKIFENAVTYREHKEIHRTFYEQKDKINDAMHSIVDDNGPRLFLAIADIISDAKKKINEVNLEYKTKEIKEIENTVTAHNDVFINDLTMLFDATLTVIDRLINEAFDNIIININRMIAENNPHSFLTANND
ncbi:hypothetical protein THOM_1039 [Trachipleistophora hominis]|uniref:Uncharacterized protein n=1 Tax=Trachipleistophora hominis TaxID=72359 RepID=L7JYZ8_TRAHO|nr:hypothetical protein THOM_1039 [Trachipleistophora hominis]